MKEFFDTIRPMFSGGMSQQAVDWITAVVTETEGLPIQHRSYILATAHHESDHWKTMVEYASGAAYEGRKDLGNTEKGDGVRFKGRGLVQITGRRNYADWSQRLHVDLVANPEKAATLPIAVKVLVGGMTLGTFTGKKLSDYADYVQMRRVVNGQDRATTIAGYAKTYEAALKTIQEAPTSTAPKGNAGLVAAIIAALAALAAYLGWK